MSIPTRPDPAGSKATPFQPTELAEQVAWVRRMAGALARDPDLADDLAQDAYVAALQHPPGDRRNVRGWLRTVLSNLVRQHHRASHRRVRHEAEHSEKLPRVDESAAGALERIQLHQELVERVMNLPEPSRSALVMRFFDELQPKAIARRLGVPVSTVHTRIQRGLTRLRMDMDADHGSRSAWLVPVLGLRVPPGGPADTVAHPEEGLPGADGPAPDPAIPNPTPSPTSPLLWGPIAMSTKITAIAVGAVATVGVLLAWPTMFPEAAPTTPGTTATQTAAVPEQQARPTPEAGPSRAAMEPVAPQVADPDPAAADPAAVIWSGRVVDIDLKPVAGVKVKWGTPSAPPLYGSQTDTGTAVSAVTGEDGGFQLPEGEGTTRTIQAVDDHWFTVLAGEGVRGHDDDVMVVVAPAVELGGTVASPTGEPIAAARLIMMLPDDLRTRMPVMLDRAGTVQIETSTDDQGRFSGLRLGHVPGARLQVKAAGWAPLTVQVPAHDQDAMRLVLSAPTAADEDIAGMVLDERGVPLANAIVSAGGRGTQADGEGRFVLKGAADHAVLRAVARGVRPTRLDRPEAGWPRFVVVQCAEEPLTIAGQVVSPDGTPRERVRVWVRDATSLGQVDGLAMQAEGYSAGSLNRQEIQQLITENPGTHPRELLRNRSDIMWAWTRTDANGRFELQGLLARDYTLRAMDEDSLLQVDSQPVAAGTRNARLVLDPQRVWPEVQGQVVSRSGVPMGEVEIAVVCDAMGLRVGAGRTTRHWHGHSVRTDDQGRFRFTDVPMDAAYLRLDGQNIVSQEPGRREGGMAQIVAGHPEALRLEVDARAHFQVNVADASRATHVQVLDGDGQELVILRFEGNSTVSNETWALQNGRTEVLAVPETARTLVLWNGDQEVQRVPMQLVPGEVRTINF